ncbi:type III secretion system stator protein SctL [Burkholderia cepacia]|uniref:type III secretion system stator protein SctL n=1 Tax=Burkholderia cepacia TaxID=292 RepID=UPI00398F00BF
MVIWLRNTQDEGVGEHALQAIGVDGDIVRREAFAQLVDLDDGHAMLRDRRRDVLATARDEAERIVAAAHAEADEIRARAQDEFATGQRRGYDAGRQDALAHWYRETAEWLARRRDLQMSMRQRMADIVVLAVERIVSSERPEALFARAADSVDRIVDANCHLRVRVHPGQRELAAAAFERAAAGWHERGRPVPITVIADRSLAPGACVCETDIGLIDASLSAQIDAVRLAVTRALQRTDDAGTRAPEATAVHERPEHDDAGAGLVVDTGNTTIGGPSHDLLEMQPDTEQEYA